MAICFILEVDINDFSIKIDPNELTLNRGNSKSGMFFPLDELRYHAQELESWGVEVLKKCFNIEVIQDIDTTQLSLFEAFSKTTE